jgi:hypothetical protein
LTLKGLKLQQLYTIKGYLREVIMDQSLLEKIGGARLFADKTEPLTKTITSKCFINLLRKTQILNFRKHNLCLKVVS